MILHLSGYVHQSHLVTQSSFLQVRQQLLYLWLKWTSLELSSAGKIRMEKSVCFYQGASPPSHPLGSGGKVLLLWNFLKYSDKYSNTESFTRKKWRKMSRLRNELTITTFGNYPALGSIGASTHSNHFYSSINKKRFWPTNVFPRQNGCTNFFPHY